MKIVAEGSKYLDSRRIGVFQAIDLAVQHPLQGITFKTVLDLSPTLDMGALRDVRNYTQEKGLYLEIGLGKINPFNTAEDPEVRQLGNGDFRLGFERILAACRAIDCTECFVVTGNYQYYSKCFAFDSFRSDVDWADQLAMAEKILLRVALCLRDLGCCLNIETHEEITSFEVVRLVERIEPNALGVTFDTGNVRARGVASYTHTIHIKDAILFADRDTHVRQPRPCGQGILDWKNIFSILAEYSPALNLTLEDHKGLIPIELNCAEWKAVYPDLDERELL